MSSARPSDRPRVSVCVPVYNAAPFVEATLRSVLDQTYEDWELIVLDDASTDGSWERLTPFADDPRVRIWRHDVNRGAAATWNEVIGEARGEFVKLLCSDDLIAPTCLATQVTLLDDHPSAVLTTARRDIIDEHGKVLIAGRGLGRLAGLVPGDAVRRAVVSHGTNPLGEPSVVLFRRSELDAVGRFDGQWQYLIDLDAYLRVLTRGDLVVTQDVLGSFRVSSTQWSAALARGQRRENHRFIRRLAPACGLSPNGLAAVRGRLTASVLSVGRGLVYWRLRRRARRS